MNRNELFKKTRDILKPENARGETWLYVGVGSGGARAAEEAARLGIGRIILVDKPGEKLEEHNIIRHILGYRDLGRDKVDAVKDHLLNINPECQVEAVSLDVVKDRIQLGELLAVSSQVYLCADNEASKHAVNEETIEIGIPLIFAGVFDGGCGGEVGRVVKDGACYACMAAYLNRSGTFDSQQTPETFDYSNPNGPEKSTAALNLDIAQIALIQARVGLLTLLAKTDPSVDFKGNYILFGNRPVTGLFPRMLSSEIWEIPHDKSCLVCGTLSISDAALNAAAQKIMEKASIDPAK